MKGVKQMSNQKQIKKGDIVKIILSGVYAIVGQVQYEYNRYHLPNVSGWQYDINDLEKQSYESLIYTISQQVEQIERLNQTIFYERMYVGFLITCIRSGEKWEGTISDFIEKLDRE